MAAGSGIEDERGVDVARIRELLALTPAERVRHMLDVLERMRAITERARVTRE